MDVRGDDGGPDVQPDLRQEVARLVALLDQERETFRSEVEAGAAELAAQDEAIGRLTRNRDWVLEQRDAARVRIEQLAASRAALIVQRDTARAKVRRLRAARDRLLVQRDAAVADLERYSGSRVVRLTARMMSRLRRLRGLA